MSVEVRIEPKGLFKKKVSFQDILSDGMAYGIMDEDFRLIPNETGEHTVIYDPQRIARGIEVSFENTSVILRMNLPTSQEEIHQFYELVKRVCGLCRTKVFYRDGEKTELAWIPACIERDKETAVGALEDIFSKAGDKYLTIFGVMNPLCLGKREDNLIANDLQAFGSYLAEKQSIDAYYAAPRVYRHKDRETLFGCFAVGEEIASIVPLEPEIILNQIEGVEEWYVLLGDGGNNLVSYGDFINAVKEKAYYDANHVIVCLGKEEIEEILKNYRTEL